MWMSKAWDMGGSFLFFSCFSSESFFKRSEGMEYALRFDQRVRRRLYARLFLDSRQKAPRAPSRTCNTHEEKTGEGFRCLLALFSAAGIRTNALFVFTSCCYYF